MTTSTHAAQAAAGDSFAENAQDTQARIHAKAARADAKNLATPFAPLHSQTQWVANDEMRDWQLTDDEAWRVAERLHGLRAIALIGVIDAEEHGGQLLSDSTRAGLGMAMHALASEALDVLRANNHTAMQQKAQERIASRQALQASQAPRRAEV